MMKEFIFKKGNQIGENLKVFLKENQRIKKLFEVPIISIIIMILIPYFIYGISKERFVKEQEMAVFEKEISEHKPDSYEGKDFVTAHYPIMNDMVLIGDSYTHFLVFDLGFDITAYSHTGYTLYQLKSLFDAAMVCKKKYAVIFIGPNDFISKTDVNSFKMLLSCYVDRLKNEMGAKVILCTYLPSTFTNEVEMLDKTYIPIKNYNEKIMELKDEDKDVYYLDLSSLSDLDKYSRSLDEDRLHFNRDFNIAFINKLYDLLIRIRKEEISG